MLKLINLIRNGNLLTFTLLVEGDKDKAFTMTVDTTNEYFPVVSSDVAKGYKIYERQASAALMKYFGKEIPDEVYSYWV